MKIFLIVIILVTFFVGGLYALNSYIYNEKQADNDTVEEDGMVWEQYENRDLGLFFQYRTAPDGYVLIPQSTTSADPISLANMVLVNKSEHEELLATEVPREGPPAISFQIFSNPAKLTPLEWVKANPTLSNVDLARTAIEEKEFNGVPAVRYTTDGLYQNDTILASNNGNIYLITGSYDNSDSVVRQDFLEMLQYISFSK